MNFFHLIILLLFIQVQGNGQQARQLTLAQVDSLFLNNNLLLLAQAYNIDAREAFILQAKSYPNPLFSADINAIDPENNQLFHIGTTGQKAFAIEQLILLGGKRKAEIEMARQNKMLAILELDDLLRNLQYQLHTGFFQLNRQRNTLDKLGRQLQLLDTLIASYDLQARRGNLPPKDVIRLKSVYFKINNEKSALASEYFNQQQAIQLLLQTDDYINPSIDERDFDRLTTPLIYNDLLTTALERRPDLKIAAESETLATLNLNLQKKLAIPDMALNSSYDKRGGAFVNQINAGVSIPLPLWNRNRGNIKAAEYTIKTANLLTRQKTMEVQMDVMAAWQNFNLSVLEYQKIKNYYTEEFDQVFEGVNLNFQKRNISILEFVDFFESYNESLGEIERVKNYLAGSAMQVNYITASKIF